MKITILIKFSQVLIMDSQKEAFVLKLRKMKEEAMLRRDEKEKEKKIERKEKRRIKQLANKSFHQSQKKQHQKQKEELETEKLDLEPDNQQENIPVETEIELAVLTKKCEGMPLLRASTRKARKEIVIHSKASTSKLVHHQSISLKELPKSTTSSLKRARKNKTVSEAAKKKKRQKEVEKKRKQFQKLKENPEKYNIWKQKDRERYKKKKELGKVKLINDMKPREQKLQRKKWAENKRKQRQQKAVQLRMSQFAACNSPPESPSSENVPLYDGTTEVNARKKENRIRTAAYRKLYAAKIALKKANTRAARYKKRAQRAGANPQLVSSPMKRVNRLMRGNPKTIKKRLLFGESIISQLKTKFRSCTEMRKRQLASDIGAKILKKYRLLTLTTEFMSDRMKRFSVSDRSVKRAAGKKISTETVKSIVQFLEEDCNSILAPGMNDTKTYRKNKKRKRYLRDTLLNLHKKYNKEYPDKKVSYATFCKEKPFWIMKPKITARETCLCIKHSNFQYLIDKMHLLKLTDIKLSTLLSEVVCCSKLQKPCMERKCKRCQHKKIPLTANIADKDTSTFYYSWKKKVEKRNIKGQDKIVKIVSKEKIYCTVDELCKKAQEDLPSFLQHEFNDYHQFKVFKDLRATLCENEIIVLIDFSENFLCKYHSAIQSAHFGASQIQLTLHTGVIYYKHSTQNNDDEVSLGRECMSFCTISESLRHDSSAVWAHLQPILNKIKDKFVNVDTLHFKSDGPTTQYRNKTNLFLMTHFAKVYNFREVSWNYSESGHGKSSADGIGGTIKKIADNAIAHGTDIRNADTLFNVLKSKNLKIEIFQIQEEEIRKVDVVAKQKKLITPIPNTMKLHQISWSSSNPDRLSLRLLSCFNCGADICSHFASNPSSWSIENFFAKKQTVVKPTSRMFFLFAYIITYANLL